MPLSDADAARALDAWLKEHLGNEERRAAVRAVADRLEDLTGCEYGDLDGTSDLEAERGFPRAATSRARGCGQNRLIPRYPCSHRVA